MMMLFPIAVAVKNIVKGIRKCPQVMPARSKRGLGILALKRTVKNACFWRAEYITRLALPRRVLSF